MFNETYFFEKLILMYLYKKNTISTNEIEEKFGNKNDTQHVNNVISNDNRNTSYIHKKYMVYDSVNHTLTITPKGRNIVQKWFNKKRTK